MMWVALAVVVGFFGAALWWWLARRNTRSGASPLYSIVLLLRTPKPLNAEILAYHAGVVLGEPVRAGGDGDGPCVLGEAPHFVLMRGTDVFLIHSVPSPYSEDVPAGLRDLRLRKAYEEHSAWLSMDILRGENATAENWRIVGRMLARLVGPDCVALCDGLEGRFAICGESTTEQLASDDPRTAVFGRSDYVPFVLVDNEQALAEAKRTAQARWPEFASAFVAGEGDAFSVKVPITVEAVTEHIWVDVSAIDGETLRGELGNEPMTLAGLRLGSAVTVARADVEDWVIQRGNGYEGGFSVSAVMEG